MVEEWTNGTLSRFYTVDETGTILKMTIPSGQTNAGTYLVSWNGHGDALALHRIKSDGGLELANSYSYTTWGAPTITGSHVNSNTNANYGDLGFRYLYVGQFGVQWDNAYGLGLHYKQARHYASAIGPFHLARSEPAGGQPLRLCGIDSDHEVGPRWALLPVSGDGSADREGSGRTHQRASISYERVDAQARSCEHPKGRSLS